MKQNFRPKKGKISENRYAYYREHKNNKTQIETRLDLNKGSLVLQLPEPPAEEKEGNIPKIMELTGNEIELRPKPQPEPETRELDDQGDLPRWTVYKDSWLFLSAECDYKTKEGEKFFSCLVCLEKISKDAIELRNYLKSITNTPQFINMIKQ